MARPVAPLMAPAVVHVDSDKVVSFRPGLVIKELRLVAYSYGTAVSLKLGVV